MSVVCYRGVSYPSSQPCNLDDNRHYNRTCIFGRYYCLCKFATIVISWLAFIHVHEGNGSHIPFIVKVLINNNVIFAAFLFADICSKNVIAEYHEDSLLSTRDNPLFSGILSHLDCTNICESTRECQYAQWTDNGELCTLYDVQTIGDVLPAEGLHLVKKQCGGNVWHFTRAL
jgi:hypothetical protein